MKILLVEDDVYLKDIYHTKLTHLGHRVVTAHDGHEASEALEIDYFDMVFLDIMLPKTNGLTVLAKMKERGDTTPVMVLTNLGLRSYQQKVLAEHENVIGYAQKADHDPKEIIELAETLHDALPTKTIRGSQPLAGTDEHVGEGVTPELEGHRDTHPPYIQIDPIGAGR
jgi:DNA-binding NtrC family response regulator